MTNKDFRKAYREGRRYLSPSFVLYARKNDLPQTRIGVAISKAHFKLATKRNRLRRVAKELFRNEIIPRVTGYDFIVSSRAAGRNVREALVELKDLIMRLKK
jgi:ribonuclease P protein component